MDEDHKDAMNVCGMHLCLAFQEGRWEGAC
jgi:hypothetical protein